MNTRRSTVLLIAGLFVVSCGAAKPAAQASPAATATPVVLADPTPTATPTSTATPPSPKPTPPPSPQPTPIAAAGLVNCSGAPTAAMVVISRTLLYDVTDTVHPRLVCRAIDTGVHLLDNHTIAYTKVVAKHVVIIRRDLTTGAETQVAPLRVAPQPYYWYAATWTWDGALEVYSTSNATANAMNWLVSVHLWSNGADHVLYTVKAGFGGVESRWAARPILTFGPDNSYVAISDTAFSLYSSSVRIFSVADRTQRYVTSAPSSGGTWIASNRFAWATMASSSTVLGKLMQWTPTAGATLLRSEYFYRPTSSLDGKWIAGTVLTDQAAPRTFIAPLGTGRTFRTGLASSPGFVTPTVAWYAVEKQGANAYNSTGPSGQVHALDVVNLTDKAVTFRTGESPWSAATGVMLCCDD